MKDRIIEWIEDHAVIFPVLTILAGFGLILYGAFFAGREDATVAAIKPPSPKIDSTMLVEWYYGRKWQLYIGSKVPNPDSVYRKRMEIRDSTAKAQDEAMLRRFAIEDSLKKVDRDRGYTIENGARIYNRIPQ